MGKTLAFIGLLVCAVGVNGQDLSLIDGRILHQYWKARWIACPGESVIDYGVYHFRKRFELAEKPSSFVVHVSADNRYRLFVNGEPVSSGPARSDLANWSFETVDIAPQLKPGENVLAAIVWNAAQHKPFAQISYQTGFILQGNTEKEDAVNTNNSWRVIRNRAYQPLPVDMRALRAYYVTGAGDEVDGKAYPWGWEKPGFEDGEWPEAQVLWFPPKPRTLGTDGNWMLVPRTIPAFPESRIDGATIRRSLKDGMPFGAADKLPAQLPANSKISLLFDQGHLVNAYPELLVSQGKGATIRITYAEGLIDENRVKGNRNEIEGKHIVGVQDIFMPDGGDARLFRPLWFRTYRYLQMDIETGPEPLTIRDFCGKTYGYPFEEKAQFSSSDPVNAAIWEAGWRTARLCAGENYFDCPYYEQLQYVGDTRIQALISLYVAGDDRLMRKAILDYEHSRIPDGLTQSRYPCNDMQIIPTYSMFWVSMIYDHYMHRNDPEFIRQLLPGMENVLAWFEARIAPDGMLGPVAWWNFVDWSWNNPGEIAGGVPKGAADGGSSILTLQLAYTYRQADALFKAFGKPELAAKYARLADDLVAATYRLCWDSGKGLLADTPAKSDFSQHANILAVLTDALPAAEQPALLKRIIADTSIVKTTFYFRFYLFEALKKTGLGDLFLPQMADWKAMLDMGLTTFAENPEPTRSDCHAWSASPNYQFLSTVLGINPGSPGFRTVRIEPFLGDLTAAEGKVPHPAGEISAAYKRTASGVEATVTLPPGVEGVVVWKGKEMPVSGTWRKVLK